MNLERHQSAFKGEISNLFELSPDKTFLDLTLGDGGHTEEALKAGCRVVSVDLDRKAIDRAISFVKDFTPKVIYPEINTPMIENFQWLIINSNFTQIGELASKLNLPKFDGIMVDLGPSQFQILSPNRGFSFLIDEPLDMRLDENLGVRASDLLAVLNERQLSQLFESVDEPYAKPIARIICKLRQETPIKTTFQLADIVSRVKKGRHGKIHPATQVFMALRMAVNLELEVIEELLPQLPILLNKNGILGIISFHSGEDRLVKNFIKNQESDKKLCAINKKPLEPSKNELLNSKRTRSAKLRLARKN